MSKKLDQMEKSAEKVEVVTKKKSEQVELVAKKAVQVSTVAKKPEEVATTKKKPEVQSTAEKSEPTQAAKKSETVVNNDKTKVSEVINLDSPVKEVKTNAVKPVVKDKTTTAPGRSVSIVKIDDDVQEVKSNGKAEVIVDGKEDALKTSTQKLYDTRFEVFKEFCAKAGGGVDPMKAAAATIDKFLQHLQKEKNLGKSVLAGYKSAIVKIQSEHKDVAKVENTKAAPTVSKPALPAKPVTRATITPVEQKPTPPPRQAPHLHNLSLPSSQGNQPHRVEHQLVSQLRRSLSPGRPLLKADQLLFRKPLKANLSRNKPHHSPKPELASNRSQ